jgi:hypothetical protein
MRDIFGVDESQAVLLKDHFESILEAVGILDVLSMPDPARASQSLSEFRYGNPGLPYLTILVSDGQGLP